MRVIHAAPAKIQKEGSPKKLKFGMPIVREYPNEIVAVLRVISWVEQHEGKRDFLIPAIRLIKRKYPTALKSTIAYRATTLSTEKLKSLLENRAIDLTMFPVYSFTEDEAVGYRFLRHLSELRHGQIIRVLFKQRVVGIDIKKFLQLASKDVYEFFVSNLAKFKEYQQFIDYIEKPLGNIFERTYKPKLWDTYINTLLLLLSVRSTKKITGRKDETLPRKLTLEYINKEKEILVERPVYLLLKNVVDVKTGIPAFYLKSEGAVILDKLLADKAKLNRHLQELDTMPRTKLEAFFVTYEIETKGKGT